MSVNGRTAELVHDPLFRRGYYEIFAGDESCISTLWQAEDRQAYLRGRKFGAYVQAVAGMRVPLLKHNYIDPRTLELVLCAMKDGALA
jgi:hypothetical protein